MRERLQSLANKTMEDAFDEAVSIKLKRDGPSSSSGTCSGRSGGRTSKTWRRAWPIQRNHTVCRSCWRCCSIPEPRGATGIELRARASLLRKHTLYPRDAANGTPSMLPRYDFFGMPDVVAVRCSLCQSHAPFEFATCVRIKLRKDIPYFQNSKYFEYVAPSDPLSDGKNMAVHFHGLEGNALARIQDLPDGYEASDWTRPFGQTGLRYPRFYDHGTLVCGACGARRRHNLSWPNDAWFVVSHRDHVLWSFNRAMTVELRDYIASTERSRRGSKFAGALARVPTEFLDAKAREPVTRKLEALLKSDA